MLGEGKGKCREIAVVPASVVQSLAMQLATQCIQLVKIALENQGNLYKQHHGWMVLFLTCTTEALQDLQEMKVAALYLNNFLGIKLRLNIPLSELSLPTLATRHTPICLGISSVMIIR